MNQKTHFGVKEEPRQAKDATWIKRFVKIINYRIIKPSYLASTSGRCQRAATPNFKEHG